MIRCNFFSLLLIPLVTADNLLASLLPHIYFANLISALLAASTNTFILSDYFLRVFYFISFQIKRPVYFRWLMVWGDGGGLKWRNKSQNTISFSQWSKHNFIQAAWSAHAPGHKNKSTNCSDDRCFVSSLFESAVEVHKHTKNGKESATHRPTLMTRIFRTWAYSLHISTLVWLWTSWNSKWQTATIAGITNVLFALMTRCLIIVYKYFKETCIVWVFASCLNCWKNGECFSWEHRH